MKETTFIEQNKDKWNRFEQLYQSKSNDPEELSDLYMDITDDLSYAQTFYERRTVRVYLNQLGQRVYTGVHKQKGESLKKFFTVWRTSLPLEIYRSRKNLQFAFLAFLLYALIGVITTMMYPDFPRVVMGDGYVEMTLDNIARGNPLGVYESQSQMDMFVGIMTNNMRVAFLTFFVGFFFTVGTHILLFSNGVMLGAFQFFFHTKGLLLTSFLGIWIHGAFEISAIVLAGAAGITAGNGLLFPGSYTRMQALQLSTKRGLKIMMSLVPFIVIAGLLESFVTANYQQLPNWSKWTLICVSFGIILAYYVIYPIYVARKHPELLNKEETESFQIRSSFNFAKIRTINELVADSFRLFRLKFGALMRLNFAVTIPIAIGLITFQNYRHYDLLLTEYWYDWAEQLSFIFGYCFIDMYDVVVLGVWTFLFAYIFAGAFFQVKNANQKPERGTFISYLKKRYLGIWLANFALCALVLPLPWTFLLMAFFVVPFVYLNAATFGLSDLSVGKRLTKGFQYSVKNYGNALLALLILFVIVFMAMQPIAFFGSIHFDDVLEPPQPDLLDLMTQFIKRVGQIYTDDYIFWANVFRQAVYLFVAIVVLNILAIMMSFGFYSEMERNEAAGLKEEFKKFGKRSRSQETIVDFD